MSTETNHAALNLLFNHRFYWCEDHSEAAEQALDSETKEETLVPESNIKEKPKVSEPKLSYLGENKKEVLMLFGGGSMSVWPKELKLTFLKILQSIKLEFNDISCMGIEEAGKLQAEQIQEQIPFNHLFLWGVNPQTLGLNASRFEVKQENNFLLINLPPIQEIQDHVEQKRKLWDCIKDLELT